MRRPVLLLLLLLSALLIWLLWPVRITLEGFGTVQPRFENLVSVTPRESGMVCRMRVERFQEVREGELLFEYIPEGKFSVLAYTRMTPPGGGAEESEQIPGWYRKAEDERSARIAAANRWSSQLIKEVKSAQRWESDLARRLAITVPREADLELAKAGQKYNLQRGRENANKVYSFNEAIGEMVPTEQGLPLASPVSGLLYSLWVQPQMQIFGSSAAATPSPEPGSPPMSVLHAGGSSPVAEIMPPGTPLEVMALLQVPPRAVQGGAGWQASLVEKGESVNLPAGVTKIDFGSVALDPADARLLMPALITAQKSIFVRVSLPQEYQGKPGRAVRLRMVSPLRPRIWLWFAKYK